MLSGSNGKFLTPSVKTSKFVTISLSIADQIPVYKAIVVVIIVSLQSPELLKIWKNIKKKFGNDGARKKVA